MKRFDCPQCGAAITDEKCPYCGAVFIDFSAITLNEPCYIKIKAKMNEGSSIIKAPNDEFAIIRARVLPRVMDITMTPHYIDFDGYDGRLVHLLSSKSGEIEINFLLLGDANRGELYTIERGSEEK